MAALIHARRCALTGVHAGGWAAPWTGFEERDGQAVDVLVAGEEPLRADMVVLAIGVTPGQRPLPRRRDLKPGIKGSIVVNDRMRNSDVEDIYAVGDAVQVEATSSPATDGAHLARRAGQQAGARGSRRHLPG